MTDQDPTQTYHPPASQPPAAPPPAPSGAPAPSGTPAPAGPEFAPPVGTTPVVAEGSGGKRGRSPVKWAVAGLVVVLVAGAAAGATLMLTSNTTAAASTVEKWAPADAAAYYEVRLDLPGSQAAELAEFMAAFPGFDDQAAFPVKLGEIGDRIVRAATENEHDYQTEIAPWFGGQIGVSQGPPPDPASGAFVAPTLAAVTVTDAAKATAWLDMVVDESGATTVTQDHNGTTITVVQPESDMGFANQDYGYVVVEGAILAGDVPSIETALDGGATGGLSADADFVAAKNALPADHLVFGWTDTRASLGSTFDSMESFDESGMFAALSRVYEQILPVWTAVEVRAEDGRLVFESVTPHSTALGDTGNRVDPIAAMAPADTVFLGTGTDLGLRLQSLRDLFAAEPAFEETLEQVNQALGIVGGFDAAVSWMGDAGIAITRQGDIFDGGVIIEPTDAASAERLFTSLRSLIEVGAAGMLTFVEEDYNGTTIVSVDLTQIAGMGAGMGGLDPSMLPSELKLAWAVADDVVVIGVGPQFVKDVLDARAGDSLADQPRYTALIDAAGAENAGVFWLDIAAIRGAAEGFLPPDLAAEYERDIKPYLVPLDAFGGATVVADDVDRATLYLTTTE